MPEKHNDAYYYRTAIIIMLLIVVLICLIAMVAPQLTAQQEQKQIHQDISLWQERIVIMPEPQPTTGDPEIDATIPTETLPYLDLYDAMNQYNEDIFMEGQKDLVDAWSYQEDVFDLSEFGVDTEIAGIVTIPRLGVEMPLYLGATWGNLNEGFAQLSQTSMPIGGPNTNCVIAGHRGWRDMDFLINIERLQYGDTVYIQNFWEVLEYRVCDIQIIYPYEVEKIHIQPGKDLITFVTCHPYRVNSHRYIVFCERYIPEEVPETVPATDTPTETTEEPKPTVQWADRITITSSEGIDFESSQWIIFVNKKLPWICLGASSFLILLSLLLLKKQKQKEQTSGTPNTR